MPSPERIRSLAIAGVGLGLLLIIVALTGLGRDWLGWLVRCGGRFDWHACADGEVPWKFVTSIAVVITCLALVASGPAGGRSRAGRLGVSELGASPAPSDPPARSASFGPPGAGPDRGIAPSPLE